MSDFYTVRTVRANKNHQCERCTGRIPAGTEYIRASGLYEGEIYSMKSHIVCEDILRSVMAVLEMGTGDEMLMLPDEIEDAIDTPEMAAIAERYNTHAAAVGGVCVSTQETL